MLVADVATELGRAAKRFKLKQLRPPLPDLQLQGEHVEVVSLTASYFGQMEFQMELHVDSILIYSNLRRFKANWARSVFWQQIRP